MVLKNNFEKIVQSSKGALQRTFGNQWCKVGSIFCSGLKQCQFKGITKESVNNGIILSKIKMKEIIKINNSYKGTTQQRELKSTACIPTLMMDPVILNY